MRLRSLFWFLVSLLCFAGAFYFWQLGNKWNQQKADAVRPQKATDISKAADRGKIVTIPSDTVPANLFTETTRTNASKTNNFASQIKYRVSNTTRSVGQLAGDPQAILLANALIDLRSPVDLAIPQDLRSKEEPGAYIVQSRGPASQLFRAKVIATGAQIVSYIPNNAYLVQASGNTAMALKGLPGVQAVLPFEPYYKLDARLLASAVNHEPVSPESTLNILLFPGEDRRTAEQLEKLGVSIIAKDKSPFGPVFKINPSMVGLSALAGLTGVQALEVASTRTPANDLSRPRTGVATNTQVAANYLNLTGNKITVAVTDSGVDASHPDFAGGRVFGPAITDTNGHGTHVAGIIAASGASSTTVQAASGSVMPPVSGQFRGKAPAARIFAMPIDDIFSDLDFQESAARTNALISNNSWAYADNSYNIASANYDAGVRDSLSGTPGSQPVMYVFAAGNEGSGSSDGLDGFSDSVLSPGNAKNVIAVGAIEQFRNITNVVVRGSVTNQPWAGLTDSSNQVASFSSRGNVGIGVEGDFGRFKPDVVAPGVFVVSTRSHQWDTNAYYNPTNYTIRTYESEILRTNEQNYYVIFIPNNAVELRIETSSIDPTNLTSLPIYAKEGDIPTAADFIGDSPVTFPGNAAFNVGTTLYFSVGNPTNVNVHYDLRTVLARTNDLGNYYSVLKGMNDKLGEYRYESGTSMAAPEVSGILALIADYFTNQLGALPSPALMKAMVINGARSLSPSYALQVTNEINYQGWGLVNLSNSLPPSVANGWNNQTVGEPMMLYEQSPTNALATGDRKTINVSVSAAAQELPLRFTLVWTDPPGNPVAGIKLVNDLDLIVTNKDSGDVYFGNDILAGANFNQPWDTNGLPSRDMVNNVENIYLPAAFGTNFSVTVVGRNVNVNAVSAQTNNIVQDYALVISSGDGEVPAALKLVSATPYAVAYTNVNYLTNQFGNDTNTTITGQLLLNQHVGAYSPLVGNGSTVLGSDTSWGTGGTNGVIRFGATNQWHFYVLTNTQNYTNAAFITFLAPTLAVPRMGVTNYRSDEYSRVEADIDMFVSTDSSLLQLDPLTLSNSWKSIGRGGTEYVALTNATSYNGNVFYVGIHSEDRQAAEYGFFGGFSLLPFGDSDDGDLILRGFPVPAVIPDAKSDGAGIRPGAVQILALAVQPITVRRVIVTNTISHENPGDLFGTLTHARQTVALNNHWEGNSGFTQTTIYEDNGENDIPAARHSDGPGSLQGFVGEEGAGVWLLTEVDNTPYHTGRVDNVSIRLEHQEEPENGIDLDIQPNSFKFASIDVPPEATNLIIEVSGNALPVQLYVKRGAFPSQADFDYTMQITPGVTNILSINKFSLPPLQAGRYFVGIFNPNGSVQSVHLVMRLEYDIAAVKTIDFTMFGPLPLLDDAVTYSSMNVPYDRKIARVDVGVSIQHPRISDLALTLISPSGKRILLSENRGETTSDMGSVLVTTNYPGSVTNGAAAASTNIINTGVTSGILVIDFDFNTVPDTFDVYYQNTNIFSSGYINGSGTLTIPFGPGTDTDLTIVVNKDTNPSGTTIWNYTPRVITETGSYFVFSENTNYARLPIKFEPPPLAGANDTTTNVTLTWQSSFESPTNNSFLAGTNILEGWLLQTGSADVFTNGYQGALGFDGNSILNLNSPGIISTNIATLPGGAYRLKLLYAGNPDIPGPSTVTVSIDSNPLPTLTGTNGNSWTNLNWLTASLDFTAGTSNSTSLSIASSGGSMLLDALQLELIQITTRSNNFVLPEESLKDLVGDNAKGEWKLEMWDNRVGATNPAPQLMTWQLRFLFDDVLPSATPLLHDVPVTNTITPCSFSYFSVDVPLWASFATNTLIFASGNVNAWISTNNLPTGTNASEWHFVNNAASGTATLDTNTLPPLIPGGRYYIGVQADCAATSNITFAIKVEFDTTGLSNGIPVVSTNTGNALPRYFYYDVSTNATAVTFQLTNMSGNFDLVARRGGPLPTSGSYTHGSFNPGTLDEEIVIFTNSTPPLAPGRWYLGVLNTSVQSNVFTIVATEYTNDFSSLIRLTNSIPYSNSVPAGVEDYYVYRVSPLGVRAQFEINNPSGDMTLVIHKGLPLPTATLYDAISTNDFLNDELIVLTTNSTPVMLTPGDWFLTAINVSGAPVTYSIKATEWPSTGQPITVTDYSYNPPDATYTNGSFCITWNSLPGVHYYVQGISDLATTNWIAVSPTITATDYTTSYCVPITASNQFFRVVEGIALSSFAPPQNFTITAVTNNFLLQWRGSAVSQYQLQWTTNLAPAFWTAFSPTNMTSTNMFAPHSFTNGIYSFLDDGTQAGFPIPRAPQTFYRVLLLP